MLVLVGGCTSCDAIAWFASALSFLAVSRQVLVTSVRNIFLDSAEADINVATSVTYLGTTYEWADVVATSGFPYGCLWLCALSFFYEGTCTWRWFGCH